MMDIAIIPARGGSKRIPRKNIKDFCGKPIIYYSIKAAIEANIFEHIVVSTDDEEISNIAVSLGAEVPFRRSAELSNDHVPTVPVISNAILECEKLGWKIRNVACIYPASPFILSADLVRARELVLKSIDRFCFPVCEYPSSIHRSLSLSEDGLITPIYPENTLERTQDLPECYFDTGQFYFANKEIWLHSKNVHNNARGIIIPKWRSIDIDNVEDWKLAELLYKSLNRTM